MGLNRYWTLLCYYDSKAYDVVQTIPFLGVVHRWKLPTNTVMCRQDPAKLSVTRLKCNKEKKRGLSVRTKEIVGHLVRTTFSKALIFSGKKGYLFVKMEVIHEHLWNGPFSESILFLKMGHLARQHLWVIRWDEKWEIKRGSFDDNKAYDVVKTILFLDVVHRWKLLTIWVIRWQVVWKWGSMWLCIPSHIFIYKKFKNCTTLFIHLCTLSFIHKALFT